MADSPLLTWRTFHQPKKGNALAEYEDAFAGDQAQGRFAVADGASESVFAGGWAQILVKAYVQNPGPWSRWLPVARKRWHSKFQSQDLPWYAETKVAEGAFATILGLTIAGKHWQAEAIGDSCLFQVRANKLRRSFPLRRSEDFGNEPQLLGSRPRRNGRPRTRRQRLRSAWGPGDVLYMLTDALARWFLDKVAEGARPWKELQAIETEARFVDWLGKLRTNGDIRNDDVTLIRIEAPAS